jgi:predicted ATPase
MKKIELNNFKCFNSICVPLNGLTLFTGANGAGKSSVIQAFTLLRRTIEHCAKWNATDKRYEYQPYSGKNDLNVELNGAYCLALGTSAQMLPVNSNDDFIKIKFIDGETSLSVIYDTGNGDELWITPSEVQNTLRNDSKLFAQEFFYLNAERIGPRIRQKVKFYDYPNVGWQGEFVAQILGDTDFTQKFVVDEKRRITESPRIEQQTKAWMNFVLPGFDIDSLYSKDLLSAQIKVGNSFTQGNPVLATNVGFGISYVLPIVVTGLLAPKGCIMIVENPEAHLHPSAQSKIGRYLAAIANAGVNVIVETHSDHVINGIQIATIKNEIDSSLITINYFHQKEQQPQPECVSISVNERGELSEWPKGFFDQTQIDYLELFNANKRNA